MNIWMTIEQHKAMLSIIENLPYEVLVCGLRVHGQKDAPDPREAYTPRMDFCLKGQKMIPKEEISIFLSKLHQAHIHFNAFDYHRCSEELKKKIDLYAVKFSETHPVNIDVPFKQWPKE